MNSEFNHLIPAAIAAYEALIERHPRSVAAMIAQTKLKSLQARRK